MFGFTFPWRTAILTSIGYLVLSLPIQVIAYDDPSTLSWVLWVSMGPALMLNIKVVYEEPTKEGTFLGGAAIFGTIFHLSAWVSIWVCVVALPASEVVAGIVLGGLLLVVTAWVAQKTIQAICWLWDTVVDWASQDW